MLAPSPVRPTATRLTRGPSPSRAALGLALPRRRLAPQRPRSERQAETSQQWDISDRHSCLHYSTFVFSSAVIMSATCLGIPMLLLSRVKDCEHGCFSLEEDLRHSMDTSVHPCDDLYTHVCRGWDERPGRFHVSPMEKYESAFDRHLVRKILPQRIPLVSPKARDKASAFLLRCLSRTQTNNEQALSQFLADLDLTWPGKAPATRLQVLRVLVKASFHFGLPVLWMFSVGRHLSEPYQSKIYTTIDSHLHEWIRDVDVLAARGKANDYLRRCAEVVGGTGQSYSVLVNEVMSAHFDIRGLVNAHFDPLALPSFQTMQDSQLRQAINRYLPDETHLWREDDIINLQPVLFEQLDRTQLSEDQSRQRFNSFLGAFVVWALSPFTSAYLTTSMLEDMGHQGLMETYRIQQCIRAFQYVMPLVKFTIYDHSQGDPSLSYRMVHLTLLSLAELSKVYGDEHTHYVRLITSPLTAASYNLTLTWNLLDHLYAHLPNDSSEPFFNLFVFAARASVNLMKSGLHRRSVNTLHAPGMATNILYRILVTREVTVWSYPVALALSEDWLTLPALAALVASYCGEQIFQLLRFVFFYDEHSMPYTNEDVNPSIWPLIKDVATFEEVVRRRGLLPDPTPRDLRVLTLSTFGAHIARHMLSLPAARMLGTAAKASAVQQSSPTELGSLSALPPEELYYLLYCFAHCGASGRALLLQKTICNVAVPADILFHRAFKCGHKHRLVTNFTWPVPAENA